MNFADQGMINSSKLEASTFRAIGQVAWMIRMGTIPLSKCYVAVPIVFPPRRLCVDYM